MLQNALKGYHLILGSGSPRRQQLLKELGLTFEVRVADVDEVFPETLMGHEIPNYLSKLKANALSKNLKDREILITSDTIVWHQQKALGKPTDEDHAFDMLRSLSGKTHQVITSIFCSTRQNQVVKYDTTEVTFKELTDDEIWFYITHGNPLDKAGGYGIQEWIGCIGVMEIRGSYSNVMGLPTQLVYKTLMTMVG